MINKSNVKRYWFDGEGNIITVRTDTTKEIRELILVSDEGTGKFVTKWGVFEEEGGLAYKKMWFSKKENGDIEFMPGSSEKETQTMRKMYDEILAYEIMEK